MSLHTQRVYIARCDEPGCNVEDDNVMAWTLQDARAVLREDGWTLRRTGRLTCPEHNRGAHR